MLDKRSESLFSLSLLADFSGKREEFFEIYPAGEGELLAGSKRAVLVGLGKSSERKKEAAANELYRCLGGEIARVCKKRKVSCVALLLPGVDGVSLPEFVEHIIEGILLGQYRFDKYKTDTQKKKKGDNVFLREVIFLVERKGASLQAAIERGERAAKAAMSARNMANEPGNGWTPQHFADFGLMLSKEDDVTCTVFGEKELQKLKMGGILGVNQGSAEEPRLVIVDYCPKQYKETILFVGKGLTFDSGGISLKPGAGMMEMKYDMCGGAAAISAMEAIIAEKPAVRVVCLVPSTDNMPGGNALKPGDVITHYGGITSEIENTDAEGRLILADALAYILADALAYGVEQYTPDAVIDLATLTGAVIIGLGHHYVGALSNNDTLCNAVMAAAESAGEKQWRLPLDELYAKQIESQVADIKNTGGRPAGTITAAEYLHKFVGKTPWVHLDIAGTAWDYTEKSYIPKGPSGVGTRTLVEFIRAKAGEK